MRPGKSLRSAPPPLLVRLLRVFVADRFQVPTKYRGRLEALEKAADDARALSGKRRAAAKTAVQQQAAQLTTRVEAFAWKERKRGQVKLEGASVSPAPCWRPLAVLTAF